MKEDLKALQALHQAVDLREQIESLKLYAAATVVAGVLESQLESSENPKKDHALEKLDLFVSYFNYAVIPQKESAHQPAKWLERCGELLSVIEMDLA